MIRFQFSNVPGLRKFRVMDWWSIACIAAGVAFMAADHNWAAVAWAVACLAWLIVAIAERP